MSIAQLLGTMCAELSDADLNAIRKARGFKISETASRDSFASFFVSSIGVQEAMQGLSAKETITLHLLNQVGEVDISFFERLYSSAATPGKSYYGTYTQQYRPIFDAVKKNLVRKGLLVMAETRLRGDTVQMERWRYALPPEFAPYLPPILQTQRIDQPGETSERAIRKKFLQLVESAPVLAKDTTRIHIKDGSIYLGEQFFTMTGLMEWQARAWQSVGGELYSNIEVSISPVEAIRGLFADLEPGEWVEEKSLDPALKIFSYGYKIPPVEKLLQQGWELGILSRFKTSTGVYYRLASTWTPAISNELPVSLHWLQVSSQQREVVIDLRLVPLDQLEQLNELLKLTVKGGSLLASPDLTKLSRTLPALRQSPLAIWLAGQLPAFKEALDQVKARWGKTLLHENLLIARVRDLSLRVQLERELGMNLLILNENFIVFPAAYRANVEKVLKKLGFVIKTVKA